MIKKRRHHYVWQFYLRAWSVDGKVACLREGKVFESGTADLAVQRDFYRLKDLTPAERAFILKTSITNTEPFLQSINLGWLPIFLGPTAMQALQRSQLQVSPEAAREIEVALSNTEEDLHAVIEGRGAPFLEKLRSGDLTFLDVNEDRGTFLHFLCVQYLRTAGMRDAAVDALIGASNFRGDHVWGLMSHIFATNLALGLVRRGEQTAVELLSTASDSQLITTDQPVINLHAVGSPKNQDVKQLCFYWPITPHLGLKWDADAGKKTLVVRHIDRDEAEELNRSMLAIPHDMAFATNRDVLSKLGTS